MKNLFDFVSITIFHYCVILYCFYLIFFQRRRGILQWASVPKTSRIFSFSTGKLIPWFVMIFFLKFWHCLLLLFRCSVMSDSLWPHGLQHTRLPCPSPSPVMTYVCYVSRFISKAALFLLLVLFASLTVQRSYVPPYFVCDFISLLEL